MTFKKGCIPWNKGKKGYSNSGSFKKGQASPKGMLGKKHSFETKNKMRESSKRSINSGRWVKGHVPMSKTNPEIMPKGKNHHKWIGGLVKTVNGYIWCHCPGHPYSNHGYVYEHRLIMEKHLKRELLPNEVVHHKNNDKTDNRLKNLRLFTNHSEHMKFHHPKGKKF